MRSYAPPPPRAHECSLTPGLGIRIPRETEKNSFKKRYTQTMGAQFSGKRCFIHAMLDDTRAMKWRDSTGARSTGDRRSCLHFSALARVICQDLTRNIVVQDKERNVLDNLTKLLSDDISFVHRRTRCCETFQILATECSRLDKGMSDSGM